MLPWYFWCLVVVLIFLVIWLLSRNIKENFVGLRVFQPLNAGNIPHVQRTGNTNVNQEAAYSRTTSSMLSDQSPSSISVGKIPTTPQTIGSVETVGPNEIPRNNEVKTIKPVLRTQEPERFSIINKRDEERSIGELECLRVMKEYYKVDFHTVRTNILTNPETKAWLEIDIFNPDLTVTVKYRGKDYQYRVGVEYNGIQHIVWPNFTRQNLKDFLMQIRRDQYKLRKCDEHNIFIITVPHTIPPSMIKNFIIWFLPHNVLARKERRENGEEVVEYPAVFGTPPKIQINGVSSEELSRVNEEIKQRVISLGWSDPRSATYIPSPAAG